MNLPKNERRNPTVSAKKKLWLYAPPFAGKTTLTDQFPDPLILTTDGNINNVTAPYVYIKDEVTVTGRITNRKFAWEVFKDTIEELEKKQNDFKTISLDLVEDTREMCRLYMYDKLGIQHESDSGFGKGWDIIKTEYLSTMRRFFNLDYENIIICSHEDISKNLTKKSGEQVTRIAPNIQEAIATKLAGMVDIVARIIVNDDNTRTISFKTDNIIFGGGRLNVTGREIPCSYDDLMEVYAEANNGGIGESTTKRSRSTKPTGGDNTSDSRAAFGTAENAGGGDNGSTSASEKTTEELPKRKRRAAKADESTEAETPATESEAVESVEEIAGQDSLEDQAADEKRLAEQQAAKTEEAPRRRRRRTE